MFIALSSVLVTLRNVLHAGDGRWWLYSGFTVLLQILENSWINIVVPVIRNNSP